MPFLPSGQLEAVEASQPSDIVGIIRFSMLLKESNYFPKMLKETYEERKTKIFDDERLRIRFEVFEDICLPCLTAQTDQNFNVILVTSQEMPAWALERLEKLLENIPNVYARAFRPKASIKRVIKRAGFEMLDQTTDVVGTFQLDDDDAVGCDYIERLRGYMRPENIGKVVTFTNGFELLLASELPMLKVDDAPKASAGLASIEAGRIIDVSKIKTIYSYGGHRKVDQVAEVIVDHGDAMFLQTANGMNVSERLGGEDAKALPTNEMAAILQTKYPYISAEKIERLHKSLRC